mgnify:CR=1 FL=1
MAKCRCCRRRSSSSSSSGSGSSSSSSGSSSSSSSSSSDGGIDTPCCPRPVPETLYVSTSANCTILNGLSFELLYVGYDVVNDSYCWRAEYVFDGTCKCGLLIVELCCVAGSWGVTVEFATPDPFLGNCEIGYVLLCNPTQSVVCEPALYGEYNTACISELGSAPICCTNLDLTVVITV